MHEAALVERRDHEVVLGVLHRSGLEQVFHEVAVGAAGPALEAGGRGDAVDGRRHRQAGEVAVEAREAVAAAGVDHLGAEGGAFVVGGGERAPGGQQGAEPVLLLGGRVAEVAQAVVEAGHVAHPRLAGAGQVGGPPRRRWLPARCGAQVEHPARRHPLDAAAQVAAGDAEQLPASAGQRRRGAGGAGARPGRPGGPARRRPGRARGRGGASRRARWRGTSPRPGRAPRPGRGRARCPSPRSRPARRRRTGRPDRGRARARARGCGGTRRAAPGPRRRRGRRGGAGPRSTRSAAFRSAWSSQRSRRAAPPRSRPSQRVAHAACSLQRRGRAAAARRSSHHAEHERAQLPRPFGVGPQPFGEPLGLLVVELGLGGAGVGCGARAG